MTHDLDPETPNRLQEFSGNEYHLEYPYLSERCLNRSGMIWERSFQNLPKTNPDHPKIRVSGAMFGLHFRGLESPTKGGWRRPWSPVGHDAASNCAWFAVAICPLILCSPRQKKICHSIWGFPEMGVPSNHPF